MLGYHLPMEIYKDLRFLAHHPFTLVLGEELSAILAPIDLRSNIALTLIRILRLRSCGLHLLLKATLYQSLQLFHKELACQFVSLIH